MFQRALQEFGKGTDTAFLIAVTSERTNAEGGEIVEALEAVHSIRRCALSLFKMRDVRRTTDARCVRPTRP